MIRLNAVPETTTIPGAREMEDKDVLQLASLFTKYMRRFGLAPIFNVEEIKHQFLSGKGEGDIGDGGPGRRRGQVTWTYVIEVNSTTRYPKQQIFTLPLSGSRDTPNYGLLLLLFSALYSYWQPEASRSSGRVPILLRNKCRI